VRGGKKMTPFKRDRQPNFSLVRNVNGPTGQIRFSQFVTHYLVRNKPRHWRSWSHGHRGDVYYSPASLTITLPPGTTAFYFYAEPNDAQDLR
jgi:hypothetical protein